MSETVPPRKFSVEGESGLERDEGIGADPRWPGHRGAGGRRPGGGSRFGSIRDARAYCHGFFPWYNTEHHHSGLGLLTPADVHHSLAEQRVAARAAVLATAYATHPERFPAGLPHPPGHPSEVLLTRPRSPSVSSIVYVWEARRAQYPLDAAATSNTGVPR
jgi:hypothetical protein